MHRKTNLNSQETQLSHLQTNIFYKTLLLLASIFSAPELWAQVQEVPLHQIPEQTRRYEHTRNLFNYWKVMQRSGGNGGQDAPVGTLRLLDIPFFDDFSTTNVKPDSTKWYSSTGQFGVYVNNVFGGTPPTVNVASFDGIAANGFAYNNNASAVGPADSLTSHGFRLAGRDTNNLYLSFFLMAGNAEKETRPNPTDSLVVQFLYPDKQYRSVARYTGMPEDSVPPGYHFRQVRVPGVCVQDSFRFKFLAYGKLNGAFDVWNLDYVRVDYRQAGDSSATDLAMSRQPGPLFGQYRSVPVYHLQKVAAPRGDSTNSAITNLNPTTLNFNLQYRVEEYINSIAGRELLFVPTGGTNIEGTAEPIRNGETREVRLLPVTHQGQFVLPADAGKMDYRATYKLIGTPAQFNTFTPNDSVSTVGTIRDYYAYDDGGVEKSFMLNGNRARLLYRYKPLVGDSIIGVSFGIDSRTFRTNSFVPFNLIIYRRIKGFSGAQNDEVLLFKAAGLTATAVQQNSMIYISTDRKVPVDSEFYIGFQQGDGSDNSIVVQADINSVADSALYSSTQPNTWDMYTQSRNALLIHPHFTCAGCPVSIRKRMAALDFEVYPNPNRGAGRLRIHGKVNTATLIAPDGRVLAEYAAEKGQVLGEVVLPEGLAPGLYLLKGVGQDGAFGTRRLRVE